MESSSGNPWKLTTFAVLLVLATVLVTGLVVANWAPSQTGSPPAAPSARRGSPGAPRPQFAGNWATAEPSGAPAERSGRAAAPGAPRSRPVAARPTQADIDECNRYAGAQVGQRDKTWEVAKDAVIGGAATAGIGAAAGAIADGGRGAAKGAAIGGIVGVAGGTLYGINENRKADEAYRAAYGSCMHSHGYTA